MSENSTVCSTIGDNALVLAYIVLPISCLVTCESVLTIVTILCSPVLHETQYIFVLSLALTDIILAVTGSTGVCIHLPWIRSQISSNMMDTITLGTKAASISVTGVHMSIIAIDRYIRIAHPFYYVQKMTKQRIFKILLCAWIIWVAIATLPFLVSNSTNNWKCISNTAITVYSALNAVIVKVSVIIVFVCYFKIALIAVRHKKAVIARRHQNGANRDTAVVGSNNIVMKSIKFFVIMFGVYFLCAVIPYIVITIRFLYSISDIAKYIMLYLFYVHSVSNFIICCRMDKRFARALKVTLAGPAIANSSCCQRNQI